jgi:hypothetical protein
MQSVIFKPCMLNVIMMNVDMLSVVMLSVMAPIKRVKLEGATCSNHNCLATHSRVYQKAIIM